MNRVALISLTALLGVALGTAPAQAAPAGPGGVLLFSRGGDTLAMQVRTRQVLGNVGDGRGATVAGLRTAYVRDVDPCHPDEIEGCSGAADLLLSAVTGGPERLLIHNPEAGGGVSDPDLSPDGSLVAYSWNTPGERGLNLVRADGTGNHQIAQFTGPGTFSPDGRRIAYVKDDDVQVLTLATGAVRQVTTEGRALWTNVDWSPDGRTLLYAGSVPFNSVESTFYTVPATGGTSTAAGGWEQRLSNVAAPVFSPDGHWVAFGAYDEPIYPETAGAYHLYLAARDGSGLTEITGTNDKPTEWRGL
jgi:TolB protein